MATDISEESLLSNCLDNYVLDNYEASLAEIDSIINKFASSAQKNDYLLYRAVCKYKLGRFEDALKDLDEIEKDSSYKKEYNYYLTRGKILYYLCKFDESKKALNTGLESNKDNEKLFNHWIKKVEDELKE